MILVFSSFELAAKEKGRGAPPTRWTTLTDEISPDELRAQLTNPAEHWRRYQEAVAANKVGGYLKSRQDLDHFVDPSVSPELIPMWDAYIRFCLLFDASGFRAHRSQVGRSLVDHGMSKRGSRVVISQCRTGVAELEALKAREAKAIERVWDRLDEIRREHSDDFVEDVADELNRASEMGDTRRIADLLGISEEKAGRFVEESRRVWTLEVGLPLLTETWMVLSKKDWAALRRFLHDYVKDNWGIAMKAAQAAGYYQPQTFGNYATEPTPSALIVKVSGAATYYGASDGGSYYIVTTSTNTWLANFELDVGDDWCTQTLIDSGCPIPGRGMPKRYRGGHSDGKVIYCTSGSCPGMSYAPKPDCGSGQIIFYWGYTWVWRKNTDFPSNFLHHEGPIKRLRGCEDYRPFERPIHQWCPAPNRVINGVCCEDWIDVGDGLQLCLNDF